ncbi:MAG: LCP family protein [Clostridia bacterium]|nr:LCP family protein [Clostridia bacterium]
MENMKKIWIYGIIITAISTLADIAFLWVIIGTGLITTLISGITIGLLIALLVVIFLLTKNSIHKVRCVIGTIMAVFMFAIQIISGYYIVSGADALNHISTPKIEYTEIGVYVHKDDTAKSLADIKDYTIGILSTQDRDNTALAFIEIEKSFASEPKTKEFDGLEMLMDSILTKKVGAVLINVGFLDLLAEIEGHENDLESLRELCVIHIEKESARLENAPVSHTEKSVFTLYISGIDTFGKVSKRSRSDVNIIATVNVKTGQILLVSTPRDYYVPLPISNGVPDKLTHAGIYGIDVSMGTLEMLYGTRIDYYFRVNFDGFEKIIDALGGVTVNSKYDFHVLDTHFNKGENFLNGTNALRFVRARKPVPGGDNTRGLHQMEVIKGVINKMVTPSILIGYSEVLEGIKDSFETSLPYEDIADIVKNQLNKGTKWNVTSYAVTGTGASHKPYSLSLNAYVMIPNEETVKKASELMEMVKAGEIPVV